MSKIVIFKGYWTRQYVQNNSDSLFVFGDNDAHFGKKGQAIIRGLINTTGIPTKKYPSNSASSFYHDDDYNDNVVNISKAIERIITLSAKYKYVVLPEDGFGTGLAQLNTKAPMTYQYLVDSVENLKSLI